MGSRRPSCCVLGIGLLLATVNLQAQLNRSVIEGIVTDPQGAVIPSVDVKVTNAETNVSAVLKTNADGYYRAADLVPGTYTVHFELTGFRPVDISNIDLLAGHVMRVDTQLRLGASMQTVEIKAAAALIETAASNFSTTLGDRTVQEIPLQGRDVQQLVFLIPGAAQVGGPPGSNFGFSSQFGTFPDPTHLIGSDISVNGGQGGDNAWYLDGNLNLSGFAENAAVNPSPDAVQEFQAVTTGLSAEYGRTGGGVFNVVLKSGSNALHGDIYEYVRNDATNARNPFTSIDSQGHIIKDRQLRYNNFGGTVGGPVVIPHLYNGKNRTFFFFSGDFTILHLLGQKVFSVPTALERTGNFSEDANVVTNGLWNPYSTVGPNVQGLFQRTAFGTPVPGNPFGANGCLNSSVESGMKTCNFSTQIPTNMLDPTAMFFMKSFPMPNYKDPLSNCPIASGGQTGICDNYLGTVGSSQDPFNFSVKLDHQWSEKSKYFAEVLFSPGKYNNYRVPWTGATFPNDATGWGSQYPVDFANTDIGFGNTYTFGPSLVNEFRASFTRQFLNSHPNQPYPNSITDQADVEKVLAPIKIPQDPESPVPNWIMSVPGGNTITFGPTQWVNMITMAESYNLLDNVTKIAGKHTIKAGLNYRLEHSAYEGPYPTYFNFSGVLTQDPTSSLGGGGLEQFMLGAVSSQGRDSETGIQNKPYNSYRYWAFFGQDDYRITPNFTLNVGLRYDINGLFKIRNHPMTNFCLGCQNSITGLPGALLYEGDPGFPAGGTIAPANKDDFAPRINFSWSPFPDRKNIIRGGYDIIYTNAFDSINAPGQSSNNMVGWAEANIWDRSFYPQCGGVAGECVAWPLSDTSTDKATLTTPSFTTQFPALSRTPQLGVSHVEFIDPPSHDPMIQTWGVDVQRELPGNMLVSVGYVGTHGTHLMGESFRQYNYIHTADLIKYKTAINGSAPINQFYSGKTAALLASVYTPLGFTGVDNSGNVTLPLSILLKQYPFYGAINQLQDQTAYRGASVYNGLNVKVQKRYSHGLNFVAAYTWSKKITNAAVSQPFTIVTDPLHWSRNGQIGGRGGALQGALFGAFQDPDNLKADRAVAADDMPQMLNIAASYELPFGRGKALGSSNRIVNGALGGWRLTGNFNAESGVPLGISCPGNQVGTGRCNLIGNPQAVPGGRGVNDWINPGAFEPAYGSDQSFWANYNPNDPRAYLFGSMGPRMGNLRSPGFWNIDSSLAKDFHFSETRYLEFRWEVFNALNHQNPGLPNTNWCLPPLPDGSTDAVHQAGCSFGRITNVQTDPRAMQFAMKLYW